MILRIDAQKKAAFQPSRRSNTQSATAERFQSRSEFLCGFALHKTGRKRMPPPDSAEITPANSGSDSFPCMSTRIADRWQCLTPSPVQCLKRRIESTSTGQFCPYKTSNVACMPYPQACVDGFQRRTGRESQLQLEDVLVLRAGIDEVFGICSRCTPRVACVPEGRGHLEPEYAAARYPR